MSDKLQLEDIRFDFLAEEESAVSKTRGFYKVMIADDDDEVHSVSNMILRHFTFEGRGLELLHAYSGEETKRMLREHPDTALIFLDVVMEHNHSGLEVVEYLRNELGNQMTRIVLRTGQPGEAPEERIIRDYDINDYRIKTELTVNRLNTTLYASLRSYRDLMRLERSRRGLQRIIETSANVFKHNHLNEFLNSILSQMANFKLDTGEMVFIHKEDKNSGLITMSQKDDLPVVIAATGKYETFIGKAISDVAALSELNDILSKGEFLTDPIHVTSKGFIIQNSGATGKNNYIYIEGDKELFDFELIKTFIEHYAVALENYILNNMITSSQKEIIITLGEAVENHYEDLGSHVKRVSEMMYRFARVNNFSNAECEIIKVASTMHDVGKIAISDEILMKRGQLTPEEFKVVQEHPSIGHKILSKSDLEIMRLAAEIALYHHERFDGGGYPLGVSGRDIPLKARMMAIVDVFDALTHNRLYKQAATRDEAIAYIISEKGKHFDPKLVDLFIENFDEIVSELE